MSDIDDENNENLEVGLPLLDLELLKANIPTFDSKKLCDMIVCDRYLSFNKEASLLCMVELSKRRTAGDNFDFENYIENSQKDLPPLDFSIPDIRQILNQALGKK